MAFLSRRDAVSASLAFVQSLRSPARVRACVREFVDIFTEEQERQATDAFHVYLKWLTAHRMNQKGKLGRMCDTNHVRGMTSVDSINQSGLADYNLRPGKYRHFKGGEYYLLGIVYHSETGERMALCRSLTTDKLWVRPINMWADIITRDGYSGPRFQFIGE